MNVRVFDLHYKMPPDEVRTPNLRLAIGLNSSFGSQGQVNIAA